MANNLITTLDEEWLLPVLSDLNSVDVKSKEWNNIVFLEETNFSFPDNPLECGCDIAWILNGGAIYQNLLGSPTCSDGSYLFTHTVEDLGDCSGGSGTTTPDTDST